MLFVVRVSLLTGALFLIGPVATLPAQEMPDAILGEDGFYAGVSYVVTFPANTEFGVLGGRIGGGYAIGGFRPELSVGYHVAPVQHVGGPDSGPGDYQESRVVMTRLDLMGGVYYDFSTGTRIIPFIGGGGGVTLVGHTETPLMVPVPAVQGALGIGYAVTEALKITFGYRIAGLALPVGGNRPWLIYHQMEAGAPLPVLESSDPRAW